MEDFPSDSNLPGKSVRPIVIVSQLLQLVASMHHIDELFTWIADILVQRFDVVSVQVWANQAYNAGVSRCKVRASASQNSFQALQVFDGAEIRTFVERMLREQRGTLSIPVTSIFSQYQAAVLAQQGCRYWTMYFISQDVLLAPPQRHSEKEEVPTPLQMIFSFFTQQPLQVSQTRAISFLIAQSFRIAISHELLSKTSEKAREGSQASQAAFAHLIPELIQVTEIEQGANPFNTAIVIPEKRSRQMYNFIDGKRNIKELTLLMQMNQKEILETLQSLLVNRYIKIRDVGGNYVEISSFFQSS